MTLWEKSRHKHARGERGRAGFTLIELMIVVSILGILAAVAIPSLVGYIYKARTVEGTSFLSEIRGRQESYRSDFDQYCDVSGTQASWFPVGAPTASARAWAAGAIPLGWTQLGAVPPGRQSLFSYSVVANVPGVTPGAQMADGDDRGYSGNDYWFIATAVADLDGDGTSLQMEIYSHSKSVYSSTAAGWE